MVFAHGTYGNAYLTIDTARTLHGALPHYVTWVDFVRITKLAEGVWSVLFDKWQKASPGELHASSPRCYANTAFTQLTLMYNV